MSESHIRYGGYGGIAYYHISDTYIALFSHFIPCGVWEAVYILDGLTKNKSDIQPDTVHGDTQAQSAPVYGLAFLLGIKLMPRIRNWKDLKWFRPTADEVYKHIDDLFTKDSIDWDLIAGHAASGAIDSRRAYLPIDPLEEARYRQPKKQAVFCVSRVGSGRPHPIPFGIYQ